MTRRVRAPNAQSRAFRGEDKRKGLVPAPSKARNEALIGLIGDGLKVGHPALHLRRSRFKSGSPRTQN